MATETPNRSGGFSTFVTPKIAVWLYAVAAAATFAVAVLRFMDDDWIGGLAGLVGVVAIRFIAEAGVVLFAIHDTLVEIRDQGAAAARDRDRADKVAAAKSLAAKAAALNTAPQAESRLG